MDDAEYSAGLDRLIEYARNTLAWAEKAKRGLEGQTTTRPRDEPGRILEHIDRPIVAIDDIPEGAPVYIFQGPRYPYASRSPRPRNVLQSPGLMDVPLEVRAPGSASDGNKRIVTADEYLGTHSGSDDPIKYPGQHDFPTDGA
jgi:hypothetical protein